MAGLLGGVVSVPEPQPLHGRHGFRYSQQVVRVRILS